MNYFLFSVIREVLCVRCSLSCVLQVICIRRNFWLRLVEGRWGWAPIRPPEYAPANRKRMGDAMSFSSLASHLVQKSCNESFKQRNETDKESNRRTRHCRGRHDEWQNGQDGQQRGNRRLHRPTRVELGCCCDDSRYVAPFDRVHHEH